MKQKLAMIAFGGNALLRSGQKGTYAEQLANVEDTCEQLWPLINDGWNIVIGHGNGPQVGNGLLRHDAGAKLCGLPAMPMDFCGSETQGSIAYMIETGMERVMRRHGSDRKVVSLVTRVEVGADDPKFSNPTKPVGPYYSKEEADAMAAETGATFREDPKGNGWRKVVASPVPLKINNIEIVAELAAKGHIVVTVGGGGIPVYKDDEGNYIGTAAVIDKDLASERLAEDIDADALVILTAVEKVSINYKKPDQKDLDVLTVEDAKRYIEEGHFAPGSMLPKVEAALKFVTSKPGRRAVITSLDKAVEALKGQAGTTVK